MSDIANLQAAENNLLTSTNKISDSASLNAAEKNLLSNKISDSTSLNSAEKKLSEGINSKTAINLDKCIKSFKNSISKLNSTRDLYELGRPCVFHNTIDPNKKISNYLKSKMNVVDLIPCGYSINLTETGTYSSVDSATAAAKSINSIADLIPTISYDEAIDQFQKTCIEYNLTPYKGIRIYTTDDTTNTESIQTSYEQNYFQDLANKGSSSFAKTKLFGASMDTNLNSDISNGFKDVIGKGMNVLQDMTGLPDQYANMLKQTVNVLSDVIVAGKKISFPNVWQDTKYQQTMNCSIKLVSPYGHPIAIKEFIIRPLMYILLLVSPYTNDGLTYGKPPALTIKSYGTGGTRLGGISNINIVKGGAATTFNVYKQPLVVDIQIQFSFLVDGFAVHKKINTEDIIPSNYSNLINIADKIKGDEITYTSGNKSTILNGITEVVESLLPININNYAKQDIEYQGTLGGNNGGTSGTTSLGNTTEGSFSSGGIGDLLSGNIDLSNINSGMGMDNMSNMMASVASGLAGGLSVANDIISSSANIMNYANNVSNYGNSIMNSVKNLSPSQAIMNSINVVVANSNNIVLQNSFKDLNKELYNTNKSIGVMSGNVNSFLNTSDKNDTFYSIRNTLNDLTSTNAEFNRSRSVAGNLESNINGILAESIDINNVLNNVTNPDMNKNNRTTVINQVGVRSDRLNSEISELNDEYETDFEEPPLTQEEINWYKGMAETNDDPEMIAKLNTLNNDTTFSEQFGSEFA